MAAQALCLRLGDGGGASVGAGDERPASWSAPLEAALQGGAVQHLAVPAGRRPPALECRLDVHGRRVARGLQLRQGCAPCRLLRLHPSPGAQQSTVCARLRFPFRSGTAA